MSTALSIGMFDGVHLGHLAIIDLARRAVGPRGRVVVVTFEPSPAVVLAPDRPPARLTTQGQRSEILRAAGVDEVHVLDTTPDLLGLDAETFLQHLLDRYDPVHFVEGADFHFGRDRGGDIDLLRHLGRGRGFEVHVVDTVEATLVDGSIVPARSSVIRRLVQRGRIRDANHLLGRPWQLEGTVVPGHKRGRELGCPTANMDTGDLLLPADGVYAARARLDDGSTWPAAVSLGTNPTFNDRVRSCEAHLLGYDGPGDAYGWHLQVDLHHWVREQLVFDSVEDLQQAIARDLGRVAELIGR